jgi:ABC-2 type transport system permease protein
MRPLPAAGFIPVAMRELRWIRRDKPALFLILGVPLIAFAILGFAFHRPVIRDLDIVVVDADRSPTSFLLLQRVAAAPGIAINGSAGDLAAAKRAIRSGRAVAAVYVPENFGRDLASGQRPQVSLFYNSQLMTVGDSAAAALQEALRDAMSALAPSRLPLSAAPGTLVIEQHAQTNQTLDHAQLLLRAVLPTLLHMVMGIVAAYAVGSEFSRRSLGAWLRCAGGSPLVALVGKLAPLLAIFIGLLAVSVPILHGVFGFPFRGDAIMVAVATGLLVMAYLGSGAFLALLARDLPLGLGLTAILCSPAFGYAGVGIPVDGMSLFARLWSALVPLRWYIQILLDQSVRGAPATSSAPAFAALAGLTLLYGVLAWWRLNAIAAKPARPVATPKLLLPAPALRERFGAVFTDEIGRVFDDRGVSSFMVLAPIFFGLFYAQPYLGQRLRDLPLAVIDHDRTELSRQIIMTLDADDGLAIAERMDTLMEAKAVLLDRKVSGVVEIPAGTTRHLLAGEAAPLPAYVDGAYPFLRKRMLQGIEEAVSALNTGLTTNGARPGGLADGLLATTSPAVILPVPLFNPTGGHAGVVLPAAFLLILQQTLLVGAAFLAGATGGRQGIPVPAARGSAWTVVARGLAHLVIAIPVLLLTLILLPHIYGFAAVGRLPDLLLLAALFVLAASFMGQAAGVWMRHRESALALLIALSLPPFFLVAVAWPVEAIPPPLHAAGLLFPSGRGIDGLVRINQMGAALSDLPGDGLALLALLLLYFLLAVAGIGFRHRRASHGP